MIKLFFKQITYKVITYIYVYELVLISQMRRTKKKQKTNDEDTPRMQKNKRLLYFNKKQVDFNL
jgi:hypothetical protein